MPELPEVETIVRQLNQGQPAHVSSIIGKQIERVTVKWPRHVARPSARAVQRELPGQTVQALTRRGKYLIFELSGGVMLIHLKMSGDLKLVGPDAPADRYARTIFHFTDGSALRFNDARKFGKVFWVSRAEEVTGALGPEPLEASFTAARLGRMLAERQRALKPLLLDQTFIAGLGNIYTDEALHRAGLHPLRRSDTLTPAEVKALWRAIRQTLQLGIRTNGASLDWVYRGGDMQHHFRVYDRAGKPCPTCGTPIRRIVVGQRGTHYCPQCQPLP
jgi:formamidopyrimidine-DNA glycosylase